MAELGFIRSALAAALMAGICLAPALAQEERAPQPPPKEPPPAAAPERPGAERVEPEEPEGDAESFDRRFGPGCPYRERDLEPLLVRGGTAGSDPGKPA